jgi:sporulation protein YlmC with PRC-barrel domain
MYLIRDVLDNQLLDRNGRRMGKVDGLVLEVREDGPPRLASIEVGTVTLARRLHPRLGVWAARIARRWGIAGSEPVRIPWAKVRDVGIDVEVDLEREETPLVDCENWLRDHVVRRLPGSG